MLSESGLRDRFWQGYPQLRRLLEGKESSLPRGLDALLSAFPEEQQLPSTWQGSLDRLADVLCIARLLGEYRRGLQDAMTVGASSAEQITEEVNRLLHELEWRTQDVLRAFAHSFDRDIEVTRRVAREAEVALKEAKMAAQLRDIAAREET